MIRSRKHTAVLLSLFGAVLLLSVLLFPIVASADDQKQPDNTAAPIKNMKVSVWPEYDEPRVLLMYEGEFAGGVKFPQQVKFLAPSGSEIGQVCALRPPDDTHECQLYQSFDEDGSLAITYKLPIPTFYVETYYDGITGASDKGFNYQFKSVHPIEKLDIQVQQPLRSSAFQLTPATAATTSDNRGFKYYEYSFSDVAPGQVISIDGSYSKLDSKPSVPKSSNSSGGSSSSGGSGSVVIIGIIAAVAAGVIIWLTMLRKGRVAPRRAPVTVRPSRRSAPPQTRPEARFTRTKSVDPGGSAFCHHCGFQLDAEDNFCPKCGTKPKGRS